MFCEFVVKIRYYFNSLINIGVHIFVLIEAFVIIFYDLISFDCLIASSEWVL